MRAYNFCGESTPTSFTKIKQKVNRNNTDYCKKDGDYREYGSFETRQGQRTDLTDYIDWVRELDEVPTEATIAPKFPSIWFKYLSMVQRYITLVQGRPRITYDAPRDGWQEALGEIVNGPANPRDIFFYVDIVGGSREELDD